MKMKDEINKLVDDYWIWLKDRTILKEVGKEWVEITTPHLDRHNDCLQIYVKKEDSGYLLTDDGYIISDLSFSGCTLDSPKRQSMLRIVLAGFGVQQEGDNLFIHATRDDFSLKKHNLVQAMLAINDLFYTASPHVRTFFTEDVNSWLDQKGIRYTPNVKFSGKSGYDHHFDFVIPKSVYQPERIIQVVNSPKKISVSELVFKWEDTRETRPVESQMFAILNDSQVKISGTIIDALNRYNVNTILWTEHEKKEELLIA